MVAAQTKQQLFLVLTKAIRDSQSANQKLDHAVVKSLGINSTDGRCFDILDHHGPLSAGDLARAAGLTSGAVTQVVDRLGSRGYVERLDDPDDRRKVLLGVTEEGRRVARELYSPIAERAAEEFRGLSKADLELLIDFHRRTTAIQNEAAEAILGEIAD